MIWHGAGRGLAVEHGKGELGDQDEADQGEQDAEGEHGPGRKIGVVMIRVLSHVSFSRMLRRRIPPLRIDHGPLNASRSPLNNTLRMPHMGAHPSAAWPLRRVSFLVTSQAEHNVASKEDL
jgi:hypothetical protein